MAERWLVIDDSATIQRVIKLAFQDYDVLITEAESCQEAARELGRATPSLIIADAALAGVQSVHDFTALQQYAPNAQFVILEGSYDHIDESQFRSVGFRHFLKKPFDAAQLVSVTSMALGRPIRHRYQDPAPQSASPPQSVPLSSQPISFAAEMPAAPTFQASYQSPAAPVQAAPTYAASSPSTPQGMSSFATPLATGSGMNPMPTGAGVPAFSAPLPSYTPAPAAAPVQASSPLGTSPQSMFATPPPVQAHSAEMPAEQPVPIRNAVMEVPDLHDDPIPSAFDLGLSQEREREKEREKDRERERERVLERERQQAAQAYKPKDSFYDNDPLADRSLNRGSKNFDERTYRADPKAQAPQEHAYPQARASVSLSIEDDQEVPAPQPRQAAPNTSLSGMLEPMLQQEMEKLVRQTVEEYCRKNFGALARELILRELDRLTQERTRLLVDK